MTGDDDRMRTDCPNCYEKLRKSLESKKSLAPHGTRDFYCNVILRCAYPTRGLATLTLSVLSASE
jgi:hypothetical protein